MIGALPADTLTCGTLARLTAGNRQSPQGLTQSGTTGSGAVLQRDCGFTSYTPLTWLDIA
jgi:hypothetical protein